ncbi:MAG: calcium/sodium antiporter [Myxococcales bacterium]|nr:calcium/sodium antiporter [Myxococcales bacterium]MCB9534434.1 calcium/sodium antiporter [Myxococcales bacterium]
MDWLMLLLGFGLLVAGGEALVRGASGLALMAKLPPAVVGLTIVAAGTSMPELVVSVESALNGNVGIAVGNVVGSNTFNIGAILGLAALVRPLRVTGNTVRMEWPVMMLAALQLFLLARDGSVDRVEGAALLAAMAGFTAYAVWIGRNATTANEADGFDELVTASFGATGTRALTTNALAVVVGVALLAGGSTLLVGGAVGIATLLGVSETVIGLTIVAAGTSTPELVTSLVASRRGRDDIAIANVVGSNIFNVLGILGVTALVRPLAVPEVILGRDIWWMLGASVLLLPLMWTGLRVNRAEGAALLAGYSGYIAVLVRAS